MMRWVSLLAMILGVSSGVSAHPITFDDLYGLASAGDAVVSPDGEKIVYVLRTTDLRANRHSTQLWMMNTDGSAPVQLTYGDAGASRPQWSPDGKWIYFTSSRQDGNQVWRLPLSGGEARQVTSGPGGVSTYVIPPVVNRLLFVSRVAPDCENDSCQRARIAFDREHPDRPRLRPDQDGP